MRSLLTVLFVACSCSITSAQDATKVRELERKVKALEERVNVLEQRTTITQRLAATNIESPEAKKMQRIAQEHIREERNKFKADDIQNAEDMYLKASTMMREGQMPKTLLDSIVSMYPQLNRAGCAQLYRAQQEEKEQRVSLLQDCINRFSECYYGDGAQVGALATYELAVYYRQTGQDRDAQQLSRKLRKEYPESVDHNGQSLVDKYNY